MDINQSIPYYDQISLMMFGFGDSKTPNPSTVKLVESVVLKQLREILHEATKITESRNIKIIKPEDIVFQIRHDRHKMQRLVRNLDFKYLNLNNLTTDKIDVDESSKKKWCTVKKFIKYIDETGELLDTNEFDTTKHERAVRAEQISSALNKEKYDEYSNARQTSFISKNLSQSKKFRNWLDPNYEFQIAAGSIKLLELIAYGIIGHIVDMALIVRQDNKRASSDPFPLSAGQFHNAAMFNEPHLPFKLTAQEYNPGQSTKDICKNNDAGSSDNILQTPVGQFPITVREVQEVLRRCYMPQVGYVKFSNKSILGKRKLFFK